MWEENCGNPYDAISGQTTENWHNIIILVLNPRDKSDKKTRQCSIYSSLMNYLQIQQPRVIQGINFVQIPTTIGNYYIPQDEVQELSELTLFANRQPTELTLYPLN